MIKKEPIDDAKWRCATGKKEIISHSEFESEVLGKCDELKWKVNCTNRIPIVEEAQPNSVLPDEIKIKKWFKVTEFADYVKMPKCTSYEISRAQFFTGRSIDMKTEEVQIAWYDS